MTFQHRAGVSTYTSDLSFADTCVFAKQLLEPILCDRCFHRHPFSRSYGVILPSSLTMLLPSALGSSPHPPVSVYGTGTGTTIAAFLGSRLMCFPTYVRSTSRLRIDMRICQHVSYLACPGLFIPGPHSPPASPQFCVLAVLEFQPVVHRLRLSSSP